MAKQLQLTISEPCHENWEAMTPVEKGRFCDSCQKQVVDFSNMSDRQVANFFKKPSTGSVCGRFMSDQLDRDIEIPRKRIPWVKYFFQFALPAFLLSLKTSSAKAQGQVKVSTTSKDKTNRGVFSDERITLGTPSRIVCDKPLMGDTSATRDVKTIGTQPTTGSNNNPLFIANGDTTRFLVTGVVTNENGEMMPGASVRIKGTRTGIAAGMDGNFKIVARKGDVLVIGGPGIESTEVSVSDSRHLSVIVRRINFNVSEAISVTVGGVSSYISTKRRVSGFVTNEDGKPIAGVWVISKKKKFIVTTDEKGKFTCTVGTKDVLSFNSPGTQGKDVPIEKKDTLYVQLKSTKTATDDKVINTNVIRLFPNPVIPGSPITIEFYKEEDGDYQLQLLSQSGQSVHQQELWIEKKAKQVKVNLPVVPAGNYFLVLVNAKTGKKFTEKIIVN